jgi:hypothetical protein
MRLSDRFRYWLLEREVARLKRRINRNQGISSEECLCLLGVLACFALVCWAGWDAP